MATIKLSKISLIDRWPGVNDPHMSKPTDGWDNTVDNCVTTPSYPLGTKISYYTDNSFCPGWYTMMYGSLMAVSSGSCISDDFSDSVQWCTHCCLTADASGDTVGADPTYLQPSNHDGSTQPMTVLTQCYTGDAGLTLGDLSAGGPVALPCATISGGECGWFWVGGVCPCKDVTLMQGTAGSEEGADMTTDGAVVAGEVWVCITGGSGVLTSDISGYTAISTPAGYLPSHGLSTQTD